VVLVLHSESKRITKIETVLQAIRSDIADGQLNQHDDWETWRDRLIFREELRGIGECMACPTPQQGIVGYATFCGYVLQGVRTEWTNVCFNFFMNLDEKKDFRRERFFRLVVHLYDLLDSLDEKRIPDYISTTRARYKLPVA
jgi:hypothetical protein